MSSLLVVLKYLFTEILDHRNELIKKLIFSNFFKLNLLKGNLWGYLKILNVFLIS